MISKDYTATIEVAVAADVVFSCIQNVRKWWSKDFDGNSTNLHDEFIICHPGTHYSKQQLIELIPNKKIVWLVTESKLDWLKTKEEWTGTRMIFELTGKSGGTCLHFTHDGLIPEKECYEQCRQGWNLVIREWLFNFITTGKEIPK